MSKTENSNYRADLFDASSNVQSTSNTSGGLHILEFHWGTAGLNFAMVAAAAIVFYFFYRRYKRRVRRMTSSLPVSAPPLAPGQDIQGALRALEWLGHPGPFGPRGQQLPSFKGSAERASSGGLHRCDRRCSE